MAKCTQHNIASASAGSRSVLSTFPEELLERILFLCLRESPSQVPSRTKQRHAYTPSLPSFPAQSPPLTRYPSKPGSSTPRSSTSPSLHRPAASFSTLLCTAASSTPSAPTSSRSFVDVLLVCKTFLRISTPLLYHTVRLPTRAHASRLLFTLLSSPQLAAHVRSIVVEGVWHEAGGILEQCNEVRAIDMWLGTKPNPAEGGWHRMLDATNMWEVDTDAVGFCNSLKRLKSVRHLVVRKQPSAYLTYRKVQYMIESLAGAIVRWEMLETVHIAFRLSSHVGQQPSQPIPASSSMLPTSLNSIASLTEALRSRPHLRSFSTYLPFVWNAAILTISENKTLEKITLEDGKEGNCSGGRYAKRPEYGHGHSQSLSIPVLRHGVLAKEDFRHGRGEEEFRAIMDTGLFLMEARKHNRLRELIKAGTPVVWVEVQEVECASLSRAASSNAAASHGYQSASEASPLYLPTSTTGTMPASSRSDRPVVAAASQATATTRTFGFGPLRTSSPPVAPIGPSSDQRKGRRGLARFRR